MSDASKWEVRSIAKQGVYFCPSYKVGSGRTFDIVGFKKKLAEVEGYFVADLTQFPDVPYWRIASGQVREWPEGRRLGAASKVSRASILALLGEVNGA